MTREARTPLLIARVRYTGKGAVLNAVWLGQLAARGHKAARIV
jgi:hypothetical protein